MGVETQMLLLVFIGLLHNAVGLAVQSPRWFEQDTALGFKHLKKRDTRDAWSSSGCYRVNQCYEDLNESLMDVLVRFDLAEVYEASAGWCDGDEADQQVCSRDDCDDQNVIVGNTYQSQMTRVCENRDSFKEASACFNRPLGASFDSCGALAYKQLKQATAAFDVIAFANYFVACGHDIIDSFPATCRTEDKTFLKSFFTDTLHDNLHI